MKVLHIFYALQQSGMEKMLAVSSDHWRAKDVQVHLLANDDQEGPFADALRTRGYVIHRIPWSCSLRHLSAFWRLLRRENYDAVHVHTSRGFLGFAATARLAGVRRIVCTIHSIFTPRDRLRHLIQRTRRHLAQAFGVRFVSVGKSVQDNEKKVYGLDTALIWNWSDPVHFAETSEVERAQSRQRLALAPDAFVIASVGNCCGKNAQRTKNHRLILEGLAKLSPELRKRTTYLHIGKEDAAAEETRLAGTLGLETNARFFGSQTDVRGFLAAADLYVMSSLHEGVSIATIEAALCGMPLLLTEVPGLRDFKVVLQDECFMTGLDAAEMAAALERVAGMSHEKRKAVGHRIRELAKQNFSIESGVALYLALYTEKS